MSTSQGSLSSTPVICIANQKGGVGKTTTAVSLAAGLSLRGHRVLLIDLDIQGSATATLGGGGENEGALASVAECLLGEKPISQIVRETTTPNLYLAPAGETLATVDLHLASAMAREGVLRRCLASSLGSYDYVIIDTAPYLGLLTVNALAAASHVLVPVSCEYLPVLGLKLFNETLDKIRGSLGARCEVLGYLLTMYDRRERITLEVEELLRRRFGDAVFERPIRIDTRHKAAPSHRQTIFEFERPGPNAKGRQDYEWLAAEVERRLPAVPRSVPGPEPVLHPPRARRAMRAASRTASN